MKCPKTTLELTEYAFVLLFLTHTQTLQAEKSTEGLPKKKSNGIGYSLTAGLTVLFEFLYMSHKHILTPSRLCTLNTGN